MKFSEESDLFKEVCSQPCLQHIHSRRETTFYTSRKANHWTQKTYWHRIYTPSIYLLMYHSCIIYINSSPALPNAAFFFP